MTAMRWQEKLKPVMVFSGTRAFPFWLILTPPSPLPTGWRKRPRSPATAVRCVCSLHCAALPSSMLILVLYIECHVKCPTTRANKQGWSRYVALWFGLKMLGFSKYTPVQYSTPGFMFSPKHCCKTLIFPFLLPFRFAVCRLVLGTGRL